MIMGGRVAWRFFVLICLELILCSELLKVTRRVLVVDSDFNLQVLYCLILFINIHVCCGFRYFK